MNRQIVYDFIDAVNEQNIDEIYSLLTDDHKFIDAYGGEEIGKDHMKESWIGYFRWFPDYKIEITDFFANGDTFAVFGFVGGTFENKKTDNNENYWRLPASWKVIVRENKIKLWQVYCDSKIPFEIIHKNNTIKQ